MKLEEQKSSVSEPVQQTQPKSPENTIKMEMAGKVGTVRVGLNRYKKTGTSPQGSITSKTIIEKEINNQLATPDKINIKNLN